MRLLRELAHRLRSLLFAAREHRELDEEIRFHIDKEIEKNLAAEMSPRAARRQAHIKFGGVERMRERTRDARGIGALQALLWDAPKAARSLRGSSVVSTTAVVTIALGVALTTTTVSIVYGVLMDPLPYPESDELMPVALTRVEGGSGTQEFEALDLRDLRERQTSFRSLDGYFRRSVVVGAPDGASRSVGAGVVTAGLFETLGARPQLGRTFLAGEDFRADIGQVLLGHDIWMAGYSGDPGIVGRTIRVDERTLEVIGVMPEGFSFPVSEELWLPMDFEMPTTDRGSGRSFQVLGRLRPGVGPRQAEAEASAIAGQLSAENPNLLPPLGAAVYPLRERHLPSGVGRLLWVMLAAALGVLLIACANVANLLLVRTVSRSQEASVRAALGASRYRVAQHYLLEASILSTIGCLLGLGLSVPCVDAAASTLAYLPLPRWIDVSLSAPVLGIVVALIVVVAAIAGTLPALHAARSDVVSSLHHGARGATGLQIGGWGRLLVTAQVALASALLIGTGLLTRSIVELRNHDMGYDAGRVVTARFRVPASDGATPSDRTTLIGELLERSSSLSGATGATLARGLPGTGPTFAWDFVVDGAEYPSGAYPTANGVPIAHGFFDIMGIRRVAGRDFTADESRFGNEPAVIVNETLARRYLGSSPVGRRIRIGAQDEDTPWYTVVGVVGDTYVGSRRGGIGLSPLATPQIYVSWGIAPYTFGTLLVAGEGDPSALVSAVRDLSGEMGTRISIYDPSRLDQAIEDSTWAFGLFGTVFTVFGGISLLLSAVGIYGITAFSVGQRRPEMSLRMALGARAETVTLMVCREVGQRFAAGIAIGLLASVFVGRGIRSVLFGVEPLDPTVYLAVLAMILGTGLLAAIGPALRAARAEPARALGS